MVASGQPTAMETDDKVAGKADNKPARLIPWVEKYRPKSVDDVAHQEEVVKALRSVLKTNNMPHLLFYGPPGTGKTSAIHAIAHQLFGPRVFRDRVLELNASDERGIGMIRDKVKRFAQTLVRSGGKKETNADNGEEYPCPPFKILILDEADQLTPAAQAALRRTMENYTKVTRFCLMCNYVTRIIEPLASRCAKFRFQPVATDCHLERLRFIAEQENVEVDPNALDTLVGLTEGDLRRSVTLLQSASNLHQAAEARHVITSENIREVAGSIPASVISAYFDACREGAFVKMKTRIKLDVVGEGYTASQLLPMITSVLLLPLPAASGDATERFPTLTDAGKAEAAAALAECDHGLAQGFDEWLQLLKFSAKLQRIMRDYIDIDVSMQ